MYKNETETETEKKVITPDKEPSQENPYQVPMPIIQPEKKA